MASSKLQSLTTTVAAASKKSCRLCYYDTTDTIDLFGAVGVDKDYVRKIRKYLYLLVEANDDEDARSICWMCTQSLEAFHQFFTKINEIQQSVHKEYYDDMVVPEFHYVAADDTVDEVSVDVIKQEKSPPHALGNDTLVAYNEVPVNTKESDDAKKCESEEEEEPPEDVIPRRHTRSVDKSSTKENHQPIIGVDPDVAAPPFSETAPAKRGRGRPRGSTNAPAQAKAKRKRLLAHKDLPMVNIDDEATTMSDEDFPVARNWGEDDGRAFDEFPQRLYNDGRLIYKGAQLLRMVCKFYTLKCELCPEPGNAFRNLHDMFSHYTDQHQTKGYVQCCQSRITRYPAIISHMASHLQPDAFKCDICDYVVTRPRFLASHRMNHLPDEEKPFTCDICGKRFIWKNALQVHMIQHIAPEDRKQHVCDVCGKVYDTPGSLSTHKKWHHSDQKRETHVCHICAKSFATRAGLNEHMASIHQPREINQVQCAECGKWVMNQRCLKTHMLLHSDVQLHCDQCTYVTKKPMLLKRHHATRHSDQTPFACDRCDKRFKVKRALVVHVTTAHGVQQTYECNFCDRRFNSSTNFYTHRKAVHPAQLAALQRNKDAEKRLRRIRAGIEHPDDGEEVVIGNDDDDDDDAEQQQLDGGSEGADTTIVYEMEYDAEEETDDNPEIEVIAYKDDDEDDDDEEMVVIENVDDDGKLIYVEYED